MLLPFAAVAAVLYEPHAFRFTILQALKFSAWQRGVELQVESIHGSIFEPVTLFGIHWSHRGGNGALTRLMIKEAAADFEWRNLVRRGGARWFQRLTLDGVSGKIDLPLQQTRAPKPNPTGWRFPQASVQFPRPVRIEARDVDFVIQTTDDFVRLQRARVTLSELEPGAFAAAEFIVRQPWLSRTFRNLRGTTKLEGTEARIANLALEPGFEVLSATASLNDLARGSLNVVGEVAAFDGSVRVDARTLSSEPGFTLESTATFTQINVAKLADFLALTDAAGGLIRDGKFTFRGSLQNPDRATASLRLNATNFQWDARQWDWLVLGATMVERRVQVPQLSLLQGHNRLDITGEGTLPEAGRSWWQSQFEARIAAKIENLTELSALMLPQFSYAAGRVAVDGSVRGRDEKFDGQLIVSGSNLKWHNAPIEELHASLKVAGNEVQITNVSLFNDGDFVRGRGVVNILGPAQYWGELHAAVQDLATYAGMLPTPVIEEPLAGGAAIDWTGEGSAKGHSGTFKSRLKRLRPTGVTASRMHPINATFNGSYGLGGIVFDQFTMSDDDSVFTANVAVEKQTISLRDVKLTNHQSVWLEGDAVLPLNAWRQWPPASLVAMLDDTAPSSIHLTAHRLGLREAAALSGWAFPLTGVLDGNLSIDGALTALKASGKLTLSGATLPIGGTGESLTDVNAEVTLAGQSITVVNASGRHPAGDFRAKGKVDLKNARNPQIDLAVRSDRTRLEFFQRPRTNVFARWDGAVLETAADLTLEGPLQSGTVRGNLRPLALSIPTVPDLAAAWAGEDLADSLPPAMNPCPALADWKLEIACKSADPLALAAGGAATLNLQVTGTGAAPALAGRLEISNVNTRASGSSLLVREAAVHFRGAGESPSIEIAAEGSVAGEPFVAHLAGPLGHLIRDVSCAPPLTPENVRNFLGSSVADQSLAESRLSLRVPPILSGGVEIHEWKSANEAPATVGDGLQ